MVNYNNMKTLINQKNEKSEQNYKNESRKKLQANIEKRIQTTMIGAISSIEKRFGFLCGFDEYGNLKNDRLSPEEEELKEIFAECRRDILNLGNQQKNLITQELDQYEIKWNRYNLTMPFKEMKNEN